MEKSLRSFFHSFSHKLGIFSVFISMDFVCMCGAVQSEANFIFHPPYVYIFIHFTHTNTWPNNLLPNEKFHNQNHFVNLYTVELVCGKEKKESNHVVFRLFGYCYCMARTSSAPLFFSLFFSPPDNFQSIWHFGVFFARKKSILMKSYNLNLCIKIYESYCMSFNHPIYYVCSILTFDF